MGIFDVNMPLLYGEGKRDFIRLQEEIVKHTTDQTFLGFKVDLDIPVSGLGFFSSTPAAFEHCGHVERDVDHEDGSFSVTNKGLEIQLTCMPAGMNNTDIIIALPSIKPLDNRKIGIYLHRTNGVHRRLPLMTPALQEDQMKDSQFESLCIQRADPFLGDKNSAESYRNPASIQFSHVHSSDPELSISRVTQGNFKSGLLFPEQIQAIRTLRIWDTQDIAFVVTSKQPPRVAFTLAFGLHSGQVRFHARTGDELDTNRPWNNWLQRVMVKKPENPHSVDTNVREFGNGYTVITCRRKKTEKYENLDLSYWDMEVYVDTKKGAHSTTKARCVYDLLPSRNPTASPAGDDPDIHTYFRNQKEKMSPEPAWSPIIRQILFGQG